MISQADVTGGFVSKGNTFMRFVQHDDTAGASWKQANNIYAMVSGSYAVD